MSKYSELDRLRKKYERAVSAQEHHRRQITREQQRGSLSFAPSKKSIKTGVSKANERQDLKLLSTLPGGRGEMGIVKMIASPHTGCRVANTEAEQRLLKSARNANTTVGNYNETRDR
jgi:hypothetical protein